MERLTTFILDTNVIADRMRGIQAVSQKLKETVGAGHPVIMCVPVYYEVMRGLLKTHATRKQAVFEEEILPHLKWEPLTVADWQLAAQYWAEASNKGRQLSDVDLLIAALATRLNAVIVSADTDFDALPVRREDWRTND